MNVQCGTSRTTRAHGNKNVCLIVRSQYEFSTTIIINLAFHFSLLFAVRSFNKIPVGILCNLDLVLAPPLIGPGSDSPDQNRAILLHSKNAPHLYASSLHIEDPFRATRRHTLACLCQSSIKRLDIYPRPGPPLPPLALLLLFPSSPTPFHRLHFDFEFLIPVPNNRALIIPNSSKPFI
ncbi:hypothetical protein IW261DRAFT_92138 [Armillaria novae-zelandiae]|uniref:Uncharacterized protein n=1 Tax=Armillaria novae-zelandiae TaxID=153914 RepID=A0AA39TJ75_9AGAR|nr:hypothetical protein IW261DRAFT_92138 [Armillaria novae-zelandiae]